MAYDPNQPRKPAGSEAGGEWTDEQLDTVERSARKAAGLPDSINVKYQDGYRLVEKKLVVEENPVAYHGTHEDSADSIEKSGFRVSDGGTSGKGVYLSYDKAGALYERNPDRSYSVQSHGGLQPNTILKTQVNGKVLNVGRMGAKDSPSLYVKPDIYAALVLSETNGGNYSMYDFMNTPGLAIKTIEDYGFVGLCWEFGDGRKAAIVFDPQKIRILRRDK